MLTGISMCCAVGWAQGGEGRRKDFCQKEKEGFIGVRLYIYVLFECTCSNVGAAWGFRRYDVFRSYRLCQDNSPPSSGCDGTQMRTEPLYLRVLLLHGVNHTLSHLNIHAWYSLRCPQASKISKWSWQIWLKVRGQAGYCKPWQVGAYTCLYVPRHCLQYPTDHKCINLLFTNDFSNRTELCKDSSIHFSVFEAESQAWA